MTDRAQFATPSAARWLVTATIALLVLVLVVEEALSAPALAAASFAQVEHVCGLCGADWTPAASLLIIGALVAIGSWLFAPTQWPEADDDE